MKLFSKVPSRRTLSPSQSRLGVRAWKRALALIGGLALLILIPSVLIVYFHPNAAKATWFDTNWGFRERIPITNSSGTTQTNFQVMLTVDTATLITNGKMLSTCADLRVTSNVGKLLPYWIEPTTCNTSTTKIWVKVDSIPTTNGEIYIYYGNPSAPAPGNNRTTDVFIREIGGVIGAWNLNENSWTNDCSTGTVLDSSGNGNNGKACPNGTGPTGGAAGKFNNGGAFVAASSQYVDFSNNALFNVGQTSDFTLSAWINTTQTTVGQIIAKWNSGAAIGYGLDTNIVANKVRFVIYDGTASSVSSAKTINDGAWHQVVGVRSNSGTTMTIYVDGVLDTSVTVTARNPDNTGTLSLARPGSFNGQYYNGTLDDPRIYNRALTAAEVSALYGTGSNQEGYTTSNYAGKELVRNFNASVTVGSIAAEEVGSGPTLWWKFDDGTGTSAKDASSNANTGTLGGSTLPTWQTEDQCISGKCLFFDGASSKVTGSKVAGVQSVAFWIRPNTIATQGLLNLDGGTHKISTNGSGVLTATGFTSPTYYINGVATTTPTLIQNQWNYVEITTGTSFNTTSSFTVGTDGTNFIKGFIDEVRFYSYARTQAQVNADFLIGQTKIGGSSSTSNNQQQFLSQGLVGYWKMDEASWNGTSGEVKDSSGNGNNGTANGTPPTTGAGKFGNGGVFNGTSDYVVSGSNLGITGDAKISISAWVKFSSLPNGYSPIVTTGDINQSLQAFTLGEGTNGVGSIDIEFAGNHGMRTASGVVTTGQWYHIVVTKSSGPINTTTALYINGVSQSFAVTNSSTLNLSAQPVRIGKDAANENSPSMTTDEVRIYNRALSAQEVSQLYNYAPGPVGWWKLDERTGTSAFDSSGFGNTGTLTNSPIWTAGKYGSALTFNGTNNYVDVPNSSSIKITSNLTIAAWVKIVTNKNYNQVVLKNSGNSNFYGMAIDSSGHILPQIGNSGTISISGSTTLLSPGIWYHVAFVYDTSLASANAKMYINGVQDATTTNATTAPGSNTADLTIGTDLVNGGRQFNGQIDDVRIYNYARTQSQIQQDMQGSPNANTNSGGSTATSQPAAPVGQWRFDDGFGTTANNDGSGGSALNGTLTNMASPATSTSGWQNTGCKSNKCLAFDGTNDYVTMGNVSSLDIGTGDLSTSFWINMAAEANRSIIGKRDTSGATNKGWLVYINNNTISTQLCDGSASRINLDSTTNIADSKWHHITVTWVRTGNMSIYIDGKLDSSTSISAQQASASNSVAFDIGNNAALASNTYFSGLLDEPKVFTYALTADQVRNDYNLGSSVNYSTGTVEAANLPSGAGSAPVADWEFEERTGTTVNDTSGQGNTGTWNGTGTPHWATGKVGSAGNFNGTNDFVTIPSSSSLSPTTAITLEAWVKTTKTNQYIMTKHDDSFYFDVGVAVANKAECYLNNVNTVFGFLSSTTSVNDNNWHHVVCTYDQVNEKIYVDGKLENSFAKNTSISSGNNNVDIGVRTGSSFFKGQLDQVRIYNYARSADQIAYDYNRGLPIARWRMDECQGTVANDSSGNGNNGTITIGASGTQTAAGTCNTSGTAWGNGAVGKYNSSLNFDGTDDFVGSFANSISPVGSRSVCAWIKPSSTSRMGIVGTRPTAAVQGFAFIINRTTAGNLTYTHITGSGNTTLEVAAGISTGIWQHVCATYNSTTATAALYKNATLLGTLTSFTTENASTFTGIIGAEQQPAVSPFSGQLDDVRIYNYALTQNQVNLLYNNNSAAAYEPATGSP